MVCIIDNVNPAMVNGYDNIMSPMFAVLQKLIGKAKKKGLYSGMMIYLGYFFYILHFIKIIALSSSK